LVNHSGAKLTLPSCLLGVRAALYQSWKAAVCPNRTVVSFQDRAGT